MRNRYVLSPAAIEKLTAAQIPKRIRTRMRRESFPNPHLFGFLQYQDILGFAKELQESTFFSRATTQQAVKAITTIMT